LGLAGEDSEINSFHSLFFFKKQQYQVFMHLDDESFSSRKQYVNSLDLVTMYFSSTSRGKCFFFGIDFLNYISVTHFFFFFFPQFFHGRMLDPCALF